MNKKIIELTDDTFGEIALDVNTATTVEFYSDTSLNNAAMRIDISKYPLFAQEFYVTKTPTIITFKNGVEVERNNPS